MFNLLKGEVYKLVRSKSFYKGSVVMLGFVFMLYGLFSLVEMMQQGEIANGSYGLTVTGSVASVWDDLGITMIIQMMFSSISTIIIAIFASFYVFADYADGAIKNVVGKGYKREEVFLVKLIITVVGAIVMQIIMLFSVLLCEMIFLGGIRFDADVLGQVANYVIVQILLGVAMTAIIVTISQICRNLGAGVAISLCLIMFSSFITKGITVLLRYININVNVGDYWILDLISNCPIENMDSSFMVRAIVCAIVWIVVAIAIGGIHFRKADVK